MKVAVVVNGEPGGYGFVRYILEKSDYIIACDGGLRHCHVLGQVPNCIVGDLDSVNGLSFTSDFDLNPTNVLVSILDIYRNVPILKYPTEKDQTDLELALDHACDKGADSIIILCGLGGRFDHQLANAHVLAQPLSRGVHAELRDEHTKIMLIKDKCRLHKNDGSLVSLLPLTTTAEGIVTEGLQYPLKGESLSAGFARGVSNRIVNEWAEVSVRGGLLLLVQSYGYKT